MSKTFNSETFKKTFDAYVRRWHISEAVLLILAFLPFLAYSIAKYLEFSWIPILGNITRTYARSIFMEGVLSS